MTPKQERVLNAMQENKWYTPFDLMTNENCLNSLKGKKLVRRKFNAGTQPPGTFTLNRRYSYQKL